MDWLIEHGLEDTEEVKKVAEDIVDEGYEVADLREQYKSEEFLQGENFLNTCVQNDYYVSILLKNRQANLIKEWLVEVGLVVKGRNADYLDKVAEALMNDKYTMKKAKAEYNSENGVHFLEKYIKRTGFRNKMLKKRTSSMSSRTSSMSPRTSSTSSLKEAKMQESATNEEDLYLGEYKVVQKHLSEGAEDEDETSVWVVSHTTLKGEDTYVLKRFPKKNPDAMKDFEREVAFQESLKPKSSKTKSVLFVNRMYKKTSDDTHKVCVFEYARQKLNELELEEKDSKRDVLKGLIKAMRWLHSEKYVHLDIKWGNVMNFGVGTLKVKFVDCDSCTKIGDPYPKLTNGEYKYTPGYEAPEISTHRNGDLKATQEQDIWSMGVLALEICHPKAPEFRLFDRNDQYSAEQRTRIIEDAIDELHLNMEKEILKKMLAIDPKKRITTQQLYDFMCSSRTKLGKIDSNKTLLQMSGKLDKINDGIEDINKTLQAGFEDLYSKVDESMQMTMSNAKSDIPRTILIVPDEFIRRGKKSISKKLIDKFTNSYRVLILDDAAHLMPEDPPHPLEHYIVNIGKDDLPGFQYQIPNNTGFGVAKVMLVGATLLGIASAAMPMSSTLSLSSVCMMRTKYNDKKRIAAFQQKCADMYLPHVDDPEGKEKFKEVQKNFQSLLAGDGSKNGDVLKKMQDTDLLDLLENARESSSDIGYEAMKDDIGYEAMKELLTVTCKDEWEQFKRDNKLVKIFDTRNSKYYHVSRDCIEDLKGITRKVRIGKETIEKPLYKFDDWNGKTFDLTDREKNENDAAIDVSPEDSATKNESSKDERSIEIDSMATWLEKSCHFQHHHAMEVSAKFVDDGYDSVELIISQIKEFGEEFLNGYIKRAGLRKKLTLIANSEDSVGKPHEVLEIETVATVENPLNTYLAEYEQQNVPAAKTKTPPPKKIWGCVVAILMLLTLHIILVESLYGNVKLDPSFRASIGFLVPIFLFIPTCYIVTKEYVQYFPRLFAYAASGALGPYALGRSSGNCARWTFDCAEEKEFFPLGFLIGTYSYLVYTVGIWVWWIWDDGPIRRCCRKKYKHVEE
eukprot:g430.t1